MNEPGIDCVSQSGVSGVDGRVSGPTGALHSKAEPPREMQPVSAYSTLDV
jgi:hypothetical protein